MYYLYITVLHIYMIKKILWSLIGILVLAAAAAAAYFYYYPQVPTVIDSHNAPSGQPTQAVPDNTVLTGPVSVITSTSITITKQDKTAATFSIASDTPVLLATQGGQAGTPKKINDIKVGTVVLLKTTPDDASATQWILIIPPPPVQ